MGIEMQPPLKVSPLIKLARWSFLIGGIMYSANKTALYTFIEKKEKPIREKQIIERKIAMNLNSQQQYKDTLIFFGEIVGMTFPPDWEPPK